MSKKYKNKICAYCGSANSESVEHIFARKFFLNNHDELPKAPACKKCNGAKSELEHYLLTVLPFGGRHADALANLTINVPNRLKKNRALAETLRRQTGRAWVQQESGVIAPTPTVRIDAMRLRSLFVYIVKGLIWHSWKTYLRKEDSVTVFFPTKKFDDHLRDWLFPRHMARSVRRNLGNGTILYEGIYDPLVPQTTTWRIQVYGGINFGSADPAGGASSVVAAFTGPGQPPPGIAGLSL